MDKKHIKNLAYGAVLTAVMCVLAPVSIPIGPVPISLAVFCVFLIGLILPCQYGLLSVLCYVGIALLGLPVCAGYSGGAAAVFGPTGGYIVGYFFIVLMTAIGVKRNTMTATVIGMLSGLALCYAFGTVWFMAMTGNPLAYSLSACVIPFIPFDAGKAFAALILKKMLDKALVKAK